MQQSCTVLKTNLQNGCTPYGYKYWKLLHRLVQFWSNSCLIVQEAYQRIYSSEVDQNLYVLSKEKKNSSP
jgi:hypothetical protein